MGLYLGCPLYLAVHKFKCNILNIAAKLFKKGQGGPLPFDLVSCGYLVLFAKVQRAFGQFNHLAASFTLDLALCAFCYSCRLVHVYSGI